MKLMILVALVAASIAASAHAAVVDQSSIVADQGFGWSFSYNSSTPTTVIKRAQSITVGLTGQLTQIDLQVIKLDGAGLLFVEVYDGLAWSPGSTPFTSIAIPHTDVPSRSDRTLLSIDIRTANHFVTAGQQISILLHAERPSNCCNGFAWAFGACTDADCFTYDQINYAGGEVRNTTDDGLTWSRNSADRGFRTWVEAPAATVPEPAGWAMMIAGLGMVGAGVRRQRKVAVAR